MLTRREVLTFIFLNVFLIDFQTSLPLNKSTNIRINLTTGRRRKSCNILTRKLSLLNRDLFLHPTKEKCTFDIIKSCHSKQQQQYHLFF